MKLLSRITTALLLSSSLILADSALQLTAGVGQANYEYENYDSFNYQFLDAGVNYGIGDFYISANTMLPLSDAKGEKYNSLNMNRYQYSLNLGYRIYNNFALFGGVNYASTTYELEYDKSILYETGLHVGLAGTLYKSQYGLLSAKAALSIASLKIDYGVLSDPYSGAGFVLGTGWTGFINEHWSYSAIVDIYSYVYTVESVDQSSTLITAKATVGYTF